MHLLYAIGISLKVIKKINNEVGSVVDSIKRDLKNVNLEILHRISYQESPWMDPCGTVQSDDEDLVEYSRASTVSV